MRLATLSSTLTLVLYTASVSAAPIQDALLIRDVPTDADILNGREYTLDDDVLESRRYIVHSPLLESREVDDELYLEARARKAPAKRRAGKANGAKRGGRPVQNGGRQNGRQNKPNGGGRQNKPNAGGRQNKPNAGGRQNGRQNRPNNGGRQNKPNNGGRQNKPNGGGAQPAKKSIFSKLASGLSKTGRWVNKHQGDIKQGVSGAAQVAGTAANAYVDMKTQQGKPSRLGNVMQVVNAVQQGPQ